MMLRCVFASGISIRTAGRKTRWSRQRGAGWRISRKDRRRRTSKKTELKLTNVARASLEELRLDYEDYLRQRGLPVFEAEDPILKRFKARRCKTIAEVSDWIQQERKQIPDGQGSTPPSKDPDGFAVDNGNPGKPFSSAELAANAALSLLNLVCYLLGRQIATQAEAFEQEGGFTERLHRVRKQRPGKT